MARLDQLSPVKRVAQIGAAIGREFSYELLAAVSELSEAELVSALTQLAQAELIIQRGLPPEAHYSFKHALVQDAAYESLLKSTRHELHARIAHVLETQFAQAVELEPELLAHHHALAGFFERAMMYLRRAGQQALARSSNLEAIGYAKRGLDILSHLPDIPGHAKQELALQLILGAAYRVTKGFASAEVEQTFKRAKRLCEQVVDTPPACTDTLKGLYACYYVRGALSAAQTQADQILTSACHTGNRQHVMTGRYLRGASLFWQGAFVAARRELDEAISLYDPREQHINPLSVQLDPGTNALNHMAWTLWMLGYPDQGQRASDEALARARQLSQPLTLAMTLFWACTTHSCCGRYPVAQGLLSELKAIANEHHFTYLSIISGVLESQLLLANEQLADAQATIERALDEMQAQRAELGWPWAASVAVNVCRRTGNTQQGLMLLTKALEMVERHGEHHWEAELYRLKGELLLAMATTQTTDAKACLSHALEIARTQSAKSLELRAALSLAHLGQRSGENQAASGILSDIYCWFSEGCETVDLTRAKSLLAQLKRQTNVPPMPQELQASGVGSAGDMRNTH